MQRGYEQKQWLVGVDEAGRGPIAGPVAVGLVKVPADFDWSLLVGVGDSKKVTPKNRAAIFWRTKELKRAGVLDFRVILGTVAEIDEQGIAVVIADCIKKGLEELTTKPADCFVKLDGALRAPPPYSQETIIKGDVTEPVIGLASICAKETRDAYMREIALQFPDYRFELHKGYGTALHRQLVSTGGLSPEHRTSYCQNRQLWGKV